MTDEGGNYTDHIFDSFSGRILTLAETVTESFLDFLASCWDLEEELKIDYGHLTDKIIHPDGRYFLIKSVPDEEFGKDLL